jgi:hypothetical protein
VKCEKHSWHSFTAKDAKDAKEGAKKLYRKGHKGREGPRPLNQACLSCPVQVNNKQTLKILQ